MYINKKVIIKAKTEALGFNFYKIRGEDKFTFDNSRRAFSLKSGLLRSSTKCSADAIFRSLFAPAPAGALGLEALGPPPNGAFNDSDCGRFAIVSLSLTQLPCTFSASLLHGIYKAKGRDQDRPFPSCCVLLLTSGESVPRAFHARRVVTYLCNRF